MQVNSAKLGVVLVGGLLAAGVQAQGGLNQLRTLERGVLGAVEAIRNDCQSCEDGRRSSCSRILRRERDVEKFLERWDKAYTQMDGDSAELGEAKGMKTAIDAATTRIADCVETATLLQ
jgi:predicted secreted protein